MLILNSSEVLTLAGGPQAGQELGRLGAIANGGVLLREGVILEVAPGEALRQRYPNEPTLDARGGAVLPGLVDPHTHLVFAGDRAAEFEARLQGKTYMEIMAAGGGIAATVNATRAAPPEALFDQSYARALELLRHGVTTAEVKSGYGLETQAELDQMEIILRLDERGPLEVAPTFLGAHAIPPGYPGGVEGFTALVCDDMLPRLRAWWARRAPERPLPFVDVFCETGAFDLAQSRRILETAKALGFPLKIHADEFDNLGGAALAASLGAVSADHLVKTSPADIAALAASETVAVALPCTPFGLGDPHYTPARAILQAGGVLALASDLNPGTAWCESLPFVMALACRALRITPAAALAAVTINAAAAIGRHERIGSIEPGKQADLVILSTPDYRQLAYRFGGNLVDTVIKKGHVAVRGGMLVDPHPL